MNKKIRGSYTLEAAILIPLILYIITALLYICFLLHDKAAVEGEVHLTVLNGEKVASRNMDPATAQINYDSYIEEGIFHPLYNKQEEAALMESLLESKIKNSMIFADIYEVSVEMGQGDITVSVRYGFKMPIRGIWEFFRRGGSQFTYREKKSFDSTEEFIRLFQIGMDTGEKLPGAESVLKMLQKSINWLQ